MDRRAVYGPRDGTVLSQQSQHRSDEILDGDIDEVLQAKRADGKFWRNLREQDLPIRVQQILHQIGFYGVYRCGRIQYDWFQSTSYMPSHAEAYSSHVDLDLGLGINQPYAPEYNISPVPFPSFSAYRDNVESSSAASSSGLHINSGGDDNDGQN
ncbi:UNVERIFIED_CONTAM: hypothetical protein Sradi_2656600 [Sesamum radiatum]|uniref:Uncharacterized protein n=1 Tax=Sesamum radiatum TaxID=300843 RepID=A0AAW2S5K2_SESRA